MAAQITLAEWKPREAAKIVGVSPDLQRQWRRLGILDRLEGKRAAFTVINLTGMAAARALIDAGAGQTQMVDLLNGLSAQILWSVLALGSIRANATLSFNEVADAVHSIGLINVAEYGRKRCFAFRNDPSAIGSRHRFIAFDDPADLRYWMQEGQERPATPEEVADGDRDPVTGKPLPPHLPMTAQEEAEQAAFEADHPEEPPLPAAESVVVVDVETLAERLLAVIDRPYAQVWDDRREPVQKSWRDVLNQMHDLHGEEIGLASL